MCAGPHLDTESLRFLTNPCPDLLGPLPGERGCVIVDALPDTARVVIETDHGQRRRVDAPQLVSNHPQVGNRCPGGVWMPAECQPEHAVYIGTAVAQLCQKLIGSAERDQHRLPTAPGSTGVFGGAGVARSRL